MTPVQQPSAGLLFGGGTLNNPFNNRQFSINRGLGPNSRVATQQQQMPSNPVTQIQPKPTVGATAQGIQQTLGKVANSAHFNTIAQFLPGLMTHYKAAETQVAAGATQPKDTPKPGGMGSGASPMGTGSVQGAGQSPGAKPMGAGLGAAKPAQSSGMGGRGVGIAQPTGGMGVGTVRGAGPTVSPHGIVTPGWPQMRGKIASTFTPTPGQTANMPQPPGPVGMQAPPPPTQLPLQPPPNGGAPVSQGMGQPSLDPTTGQPMAPATPGQQGQPQPQQGATPPGPVNPLTGQPITSPMQDPPPQSLPSNPRMTPPRAVEPVDIHSRQVLGGLQADRNYADQPMNSMDATSDMKAEAAAMGSKTAESFHALSRAAQQLLVSTFHRDLISAIENSKQAGSYTFDAEDCPKCGASMEGDPYDGKCNSCGHLWGTRTKQAMDNCYAHGCKPDGSGGCTCKGECPSCSPERNQLRRQKQAAALPGGMPNTLLNRPKWLVDLHNMGVLGSSSNNVVEPGSSLLSRLLGGIRRKGQDLYAGVGGYSKTRRDLNDLKFQGLTSTRAARQAERQGVRIAKDPVSSAGSRYGYDPAASDLANMQKRRYANMVFTANDPGAQRIHAELGADPNPLRARLLGTDTARSARRAMTNIDEAAARGRRDLQFLGAAGLGAGYGVYKASAVLSAPLAVSKFIKVAVGQSIEQSRSPDNGSNDTLPVESGKFIKAAISRFIDPLSSAGTSTLFDGEETESALRDKRAMALKLTATGDEPTQDKIQNLSDWQATGQDAWDSLKKYRRTKEAGVLDLGALLDWADKTAAPAMMPPPDTVPIGYPQMFDDTYSTPTKALGPKQPGMTPTPAPRSTGNTTAIYRPSVTSPSTVTLPRPGANPGTRFGRIAGRAGAGVGGIAAGIGGKMLFDRLFKQGSLIGKEKIARGNPFMLLGQGAAKQAPKALGAVGGAGASAAGAALKPSWMSTLGKGLTSAYRQAGPTASGAFMGGVVGDDMGVGGGHVTGPLGMQFNTRGMMAGAAVFNPMMRRAAQRFGVGASTPLAGIRGAAVGGSAGAGLDQTLGAFGYNMEPMVGPDGQPVMGPDGKPMMRPGRTFTRLGAFGGMGLGGTANVGSHFSKHLAPGSMGHSIAMGSNRGMQYMRDFFKGSMDPTMMAIRKPVQMMSGGKFQGPFAKQFKGTPSMARMAGRMTAGAGMVGTAYGMASGALDQKVHNAMREGGAHLMAEGMPEIEQWADNYMQQRGMLDENGQFDPTQAMNRRGGMMQQGMDGILRSMGLDAAHMSPIQKMMILGGGGAGGMGLMTGNPIIAGTGAAAAGIGYMGSPRLQQGQPQQQQQMLSAMTPHNPIMPQYRDEFRHQQSLQGMG